jgi:hypothetical protein
MPRARWVLSICCLIVPATVRSQLERSDSLHILSAAHAAQSHFERARREMLPRVGDDEGHPCETVVGRMCHWQEEADDEDPAPEPRAITRSRRALIATLAHLNAVSPGDNWIAGERIRYMIEDGEDSAAVTVAGSCAPPRWYCKVLRGYALHKSERYADAAAEFDSSLATMPATERCRWNDISVLLDDGERETYDLIPCGQRDSLERRFWELAQPSFAVSGNDRRTEHFSRIMLADLAENATNTYGLEWGPDMRELLIRYGEPSWYSVAWPGPFVTNSTPIGHDRVPSFQFVPVTEGDSVSWDAHAQIARERYAPPYLDTLTDLDAQFAMMKRGDSAMVFAIYTDTTSSLAMLGISGILGDTALDRDRGRHVRRAHAAWKGVMVGMEEFDPARRRDARARRWLAPPPHAQGAPDLSTLLLFTADTSAQVETLDEALSHALVANELRGTRRLGLYWEAYGVVHDSSRLDSVTHAAADSQMTAQNDSTARASSDSSGIEVTVTRADGGIAHWISQALHITRRDSPIAVRWRDSQSAGIASHSVMLDLSQLPAGTYEVRVAAGPDDAHRTETSREIKLND